MRYLTSVFIILMGVIAVCGFVFKWSGLVTWSLVLILFLAAAYCTKFRKEKNDEEK